MARLIKFDYSMGGKKTYGNKAKKQQAYTEARKHIHRLPDDEELLIPDKRSPGVSPKSNRLLKKPLKFRGPISVPSDDMDIDHVSESRMKTTSLFDKALTGKLQTVKSQGRSIYGNLEDFNARINEQKRSKFTNSSSDTRYLPTPPLETQKRTPDRMSNPAHVEMSPAKKAKTSDHVPLFIPTETSRFFKQIIQAEPIKESYTRKQYQDDAPPSLPREDILGNRLSKKSTMAKLWSENQAKSPLLRLPEEVRQLVYDYVFRAPTTKGSNTILIGYQAYATMWKDDEVVVEGPAFKYYCTVLRKSGNPWAEQTRDPSKFGTSYPLLDGVCRQLYVETAVLPYHMNRIAFDSHNIMVNFLLLEQRLSRQQCEAISCLLLPDALPAANILMQLPKLADVFLAIGSGTPVRAGWYTVVRPNGEEPYLEHNVTGHVPASSA